MCYFAVDAIFNENKMMVISYIVVSLMVMGRIVYGLTFGKEGEKLEIVVPSLVVVFLEVCQIITSVPMIQSFGWKLYRKIGSSKVLHRLYANYHTFVAVVKVDFVFCLLVGMLGFFFIMFRYWWVYLLLALGLFVSLGRFCKTEIFMSQIFKVSAPVVIYLGIRRERKIFCFAHLGTSLLLPAFLIYKIILIWLPSSHDIITDWAGSAFSQTEIKIGVTIFAALAIICRIILMAMTIVCMVGFGKGLRDVFYRTKEGILLQAQTSYYSTASADTSNNNNALFRIDSSGEVIANSRRKSKPESGLTRSISEDSGFVDSSENESDDGGIVTPIHIGSHNKK